LTAYCSFKFCVLDIDPENYGFETGGDVLSAVNGNNTDGREHYVAAEYVQTGVGGDESANTT
jgi:hypothetical protein